jgi:hypothetical protein
MMEINGHKYEDGIAEYVSGIESMEELELSFSLENTEEEKQACRECWQDMQA